MGNQYVYLTVHGVPRHILTVYKRVSLDTAHPSVWGKPNKT